MTENSVNRLAGRYYDVTVVGSANVDLVVRVDRRPGAGETVLGGDVAVQPGGKAANQAVAAARLGSRVAFLGRVGSDGHGTFLLDALRTADVDVDRVAVTEAPTGVGLIVVDGGGDRSVVVSPGANAWLTPADVEAAIPLFARSSVVCLQMEVSHDAVFTAARAAEAAGARVVLNLAPPAHLPPDVRALCDPLVVNEEEASLLLRLAGGDEGAVDADASALTVSKALLDLGPRSVVITLGASGAVVADADGTEHVPAPRVRAVDVTGAGDAFCGGLAARLAARDSLREAVSFATRAGAGAVRTTGAQGSFPTAAEVDAL